MALPTVPDARFDFRGGVNTAFTEDALDKTELRALANGRYTALGGFEKRGSTKKLHATVLEGGTHPIRGAAYYALATPQLVAICNGSLFYKTLAAADFTKVASTIPDVRCRFFTYRQGNAIVLYILAGSLWSWDGASLTDITPTVDGSLTAFTDGLIYKNRAFAHQDSKRIFASARLDPTLWAIEDGGDSFDIETYDAEPLVVLQKVGSSILPMKENNVARYTGVSSEDLKIDTEQEGVSDTVGARSRNSAAAIDEAVMFLSEKGIYLATESGVEQKDVKINNRVRAWAAAYAQYAVSVYNKDRSELLIIGPSPNSTHNDEAWVLNMQLGAWCGPWTFTGFTVACASRFQRANAEDSIMFGTDTGWVVDGDATDLAFARDFVSSSGSRATGTAIALAATLPELLAGAPNRVKTWKRPQSFEADLAAAGSMVVEIASEYGTFSVTIASQGAGVTDYEFKMTSALGRRPVMTLRESTDELVTVNGLILVHTVGRTRR